MFSYSHKRPNAVDTIESTSAVTVDNERGRDPALLFQSCVIVSQSGYKIICLEEVMKYAAILQISLSQCQHTNRQHAVTVIGEDTDLLVLLLYRAGSLFSVRQG